MIDIVTQEFRAAVKDFFYLLNHGYSETTSVKTVGDRYRLDSIQRLALFRGIACRDQAAARKAKIITHIEDEILHVDGYNVNFTIMNYLLGKLVFIANDGLMRDCGQGYGKIERQEIFERAAHLFIDYIKQNPVQAVEILLDQPLPGSSDHLLQFRQYLAEAGIAGAVRLSHAVDAGLKQVPNGVIVTSDSEIIDCSSRPVADLARTVLETVFAVQAIDFSALI